MIKSKNIEDFHLCRGDYIEALKRIEFDAIIAGLEDSFFKVS
jgi:hypothetical protein